MWQGPKIAKYVITCCNTPWLLRLSGIVVTNAALFLHHGCIRVVTNAAEIECGGLMVPSRLGLLTRVTTGNLPHFIYPLHSSSYITIFSRV